jgi:hypothetical protein
MENENELSSSNESGKRKGISTIVHNHNHPVKPSV